MTTSKNKDFFFTEINPKVLDAQYAVRGLVPTTAGEIQVDLKTNPTKYPFNQITFCNIGNPQIFKQKPITFYRQVQSCVLNPKLLDNESINPDARKRAKKLLQEIISMGSYTHSLGIASVREDVANFIHKADKVEKPSINDIYMTEGASQGVHIILSAMVCQRTDAIMIPIPQYPLYSAAISLYGGTPAPYFLNEQKSWQLELSEMQRAYNESTKKGLSIKCLVVINPGNPTGAVLSKQSIQDVIKFAVDKKLFIIADEVYRENIYKEGVEFVSFRAALETLPEQYRQKCELASLHSVSKGLQGECGLRGGYLYLHNFNPKVKEQLSKLKSINLCSNTVGQVMVSLMVNPPLENVSKQTSQQFKQEYSTLLESMKKRAKLVSQFLNGMKNIKSNDVEGAMYAFPSVHFSQAAIKAAGKQSVDLFYCLEVLKNTGIVFVPGSGFGQKPNTYHFRTTILILPEEKLETKMKELRKFNDSFHEKYKDLPSL